MIQPYPHQAKSIDEIFQKFQVNQRVLYQLPTGGGKTVIFSEVAQEYIKRWEKKVLILRVHSFLFFSMFGPFLCRLLIHLPLKLCMFDCKT
jgi:superfamily II DNA or RNA helicase